MESPTSSPRPLTAAQAASEHPALPPFPRWLPGLALLAATTLGLAGLSRVAGLSGEAGPTRSRPAASPDDTVPSDPVPFAPLPGLLSATGLYVGPGSSVLHPEVHEFSPQYPLWSDGATKRRFVRLPPGGTIDASNEGAWVFPTGTRFWKEFSFGRRAETRYMERQPDGSWRFASYVWEESGKDARLVAEGGQPGVAPIADTGLLHDIPSRGDCQVCHEGVGERAPVLGFSALQLSPERDGLAPHVEVRPDNALDLERLRARGLLSGATQGSVDSEARPSIIAESPEGRAALGYLHANCASCHNRSGPLADLGLDFEQTGRKGDAERVLSSLVNAPARFRLPGAEHSVRVVPGAPAESVLSFRLGSRNVVQQMPPLGSKVVDQEATKLVASWITNMNPKTPHGTRK